MSFVFFFFQAEDGIRDFCLSRGLGDVYKRQTYKVKVVFNENGGETMEDKILRIVRNDMVTNDGTCGIMETPQMSRQSERSAS